MFCEAKIDAIFLTTEITEAGSLGARRTPKGLRRVPLDILICMIGECDKLDSNAF